MMLLLLLITAPSLAAGGRGSSFEEGAAAATPSFEEKTSRGGAVHERALQVANTNDYVNYEPTPTFSKPPRKVIPN
ncbi:unnamed protein product [Linum trigynum]